MSSPLIGTWLPIKAELEGDPAPDMVLQKMQVEITSETYCVRFGADVADRGTYYVESTVPHLTMILQGIDGPNAGRTIRAIYQLVGDRLRICYGLDGVLPTDFETVGLKRRYTATYRRAKAGEKES